MTLRDFLAEGAFPIFAHSLHVKNPVPLHEHDFTELTIVFEGSSKHQIGNCVYEVQAGDVYILKGDVKHCYLEPRNLLVGNVMFDISKLDFPEQDFREISGYRALFELEPKTRRQHTFKSRLQLSPSELREIHYYHSELLEELEKRESGYEFISRNILLNLVARLARFYSRMSKSKPRSLNNVSKIMSYMDKHLNEQFTLEDLSRISYMSKRNLLRAFREATNSSPIEYLINARLDLACELLRESDKSVTDIALAIGMNSPEYFCRQFRKKFNTTPLKYRQKMKI